MKRIALVLWSGLVGGAETFSVSLAQRLRDEDASIGVVFVGDPEPLARFLDDAAIPYLALGLRRGRHVVGKASRLVRSARALGPDGALLIQPGILAAAMRAGGYRGRVVVVNHGEPLHDVRTDFSVRVKRAVDGAVGRWGADVEVAVSDAVLRALRGRSHARRLVRIYNGVDLDVFAPATDGARPRLFTIGWAGRLISGKGLEGLIAAAARVRQRVPLVLRLAGEGPLRASLERLGRSLGTDVVRFEGMVADMPAFWRRCTVAAMPSSELVESFGMSAAEAMACGVPVVASRNGALPEVVSDGETGLLCQPGDIDALAAALERYAVDDQVRRLHGLNARRRCQERFDIRDCARRYRALFEGARS